MVSILFPIADEQFFRAFSYAAQHISVLIQIQKTNNRVLLALQPLKDRYGDSRRPIFLYSLY